MTTLDRAAFPLRGTLKFSLASRRLLSACVLTAPPMYRVVKLKIRVQSLRTLRHARLGEALVRCRRAAGTTSWSRA